METFLNSFSSTWAAIALVLCIALMPMVPTIIKWVTPDVGPKDAEKKPFISIPKEQPKPEEPVPEMVQVLEYYHNDQWVEVPPETRHLFRIVSKPAKTESGPGYTVRRIPT